MTINVRVKLIADLLQAANERGCKIPDEAVKLILNDKNNMAVFKTTAYKNVRKTITEAKNLIKKRAAAFKSLH